MSADHATCGKSELNVLIIALVKRPRFYESNLKMALQPRGFIYMICVL